jgi:hypothetical protein
VQLECRLRQVIDINGRWVYPYIHARALLPPALAQVVVCCTVACAEHTCCIVQYITRAAHEFAPTLMHLLAVTASQRQALSLERWCGCT